MADWADYGRPNVANYPLGAAGVHPTWVGRGILNRNAPSAFRLDSVPTTFARQRHHGYCILYAAVLKYGCVRGVRLMQLMLNVRAHVDEDDPLAILESVVAGDEIMTLYYGPLSKMESTK
ncbi:hypothetical protein Trydic_g8260 [Trypoxylus dichotomus]